MGIGDLLKRRRDRESALSPDALAEIGASSGEAGEPAGGQAGGAGSTTADPEQTGAGGPEAAEPSRRAVLPGADTAELAAMLRRAAATGMPQVSTESHEIDLDGGELAQTILGALAAGGVAEAGQAREVDPEELRELRDLARAALRSRGFDPDAGPGAGPGSGGMP